jgi:sec-independent protein translocase protein TatA
MEALSPWHFVIVAVVAAVLFFGWKQLPDMTRSLGRSLRIFKTEIKGMSEDTTREARDLAQATSAATAPVAAAVRPLPYRQHNAS